MNIFNADYSFKNTPTPSKETYFRRLLGKIIDVIRRMRWEDFYFDYTQLDTSDSDIYSREIHSKKCPPKIKELEPFEEDLLILLNKNRFKKSKNEFQRKLQ